MASFNSKWISKVFCFLITDDVPCLNDNPNDFSDEDDIPLSKTVQNKPKTRKLAKPKSRQKPRKSTESPTTENQTQKTENLSQWRVKLKRLTNREISKYTCDPNFEPLPKKIRLTPKKSAEPKNSVDKENSDPNIPTAKVVQKEFKNQSVQTMKEEFVDTTDIKRYIFYCCDKCDFKAKEGTEFKTHLVSKHEPLDQNLFPNQNQNQIQSLVDNKDYVQVIQKESPGQSPIHAMFTGKFQTLQIFFSNFASNVSKQSLDITE